MARATASQGSTTQHIPYMTLRNRFWELPEHALLDLVQAESTPEGLYHQEYIPEVGDDEAWEPEEGERASDDWDPLPYERQTEDAMDRQEPEPCREVMDVAPIMPAVLVDCEHTPTGPGLTVQLAHLALLSAQVQTWYEHGQRDHATALAQRLTRLLEISRYIVAYQQEFFLRQGPRKPLTAIQVAAALWPDESLKSKKGAVSRLVQDKRLRTPWDEVIPLTDLLPSISDCLPEHICAILREQDRVRVHDGRLVVEAILPVDSQDGPSIVKALHERWRAWLGRVDGLSPESVKRAMKLHNIPRLASERKAAYEQGKAWWMAVP
jgi:hypothetical protein